MTMTRAYPKDLAELVRSTWPADARPLPRRLEALIGVAYHASFLRDEERPVTCRILVVALADLPDTAGPPEGLLPLAFESPRPYDEHELRRLSPAASAQRAFVGVEERGDDLTVWGI